MSNNIKPLNGVFNNLAEVSVQAMFNNFAKIFPPDISDLQREEMEKCYRAGMFDFQCLVLSMMDTGTDEEQEKCLNKLYRENQGWFMNKVRAKFEALLKRAVSEMKSNG